MSLSVTVAILLSSLLLAFYDLAKKHSVRDNAVISVLFLATFSGFLFYAASLALAGRIACVTAFTAREGGLILVKAGLVGCSWTFVYYAMRALPISVVAPLRASAPFWTLAGAVALFGEIPTWVQGMGMACVLLGYLAFSLAGRTEGISFLRHPGIRQVFLGTLLGAASSLYDKYLLQGAGMNREMMQFWFALDLTVLLGLYWLGRRLFFPERVSFRWRWTIPVVGVLLICSDWFYFLALSEPGVFISRLSLIRRSAVVVTFLVGAAVFREKNLLGKALALAAILVGVILLCLY